MAKKATRRTVEEVQLDEAEQVAPPRIETGEKFDIPPAGDPVTVVLTGTVVQGSPYAPTFTFRTNDAFRPVWIDLPVSAIVKDEGGVGE